MNLRLTESARAAGVNREVLRYYERRGLLDAPERSPGGHRLYDGTVQTLRVIKAPGLGFTPDEVACWNWGLVAALPTPVSSSEA